MKTYKLSFLIETESDTDYREIDTFTDLKTAEKEYKKPLKMHLVTDNQMKMILENT